MHNGIVGGALSTLFCPGRNRMMSQVADRLEELGAPDGALGALGVNQDDDARRRHAEHNMGGLSNMLLAANNLDTGEERTEAILRVVDATMEDFRYVFVCVVLCVLLCVCDDNVIVF